MASEYGWSLQDIMYKVYPEDFFLLTRQIKMRRLDQIITDVNIVAAPQSENTEFVDDVIKTRKYMQGSDPDPVIDRKGVDYLKNQLGISKMIGVPKV